MRWKKKACPQGHEAGLYSQSTEKSSYCKAARKQGWLIWRDVGAICGIGAGHRHGILLQWGLGGRYQDPLCYFPTQETPNYFKTQS